MNFKVIEHIRSDGLPYSGGLIVCLYECKYCIPDQDLVKS